MKLVKALLFAFALAAAGFTQNSQAAFDTNRIVVLVSLDGLANFYLNDPKAEMPYLREIAKEGVQGRSR